MSNPNATPATETTTRRQRSLKPTVQLRAVSYPSPAELATAALSAQPLARR